MTNDKDINGRGGAQAGGDKITFTNGPWLILILWRWRSIFINGDRRLFFSQQLWKIIGEWQREGWSRRKTSLHRKDCFHYSKKGKTLLDASWKASRASFVVFLCLNPACLDLHSESGEIFFLKSFCSLFSHLPLIIDLKSSLKMFIMMFFWGTVQ